MAYNINSKDQLIEYCKRRLGDPVSQINVTDDQYADCFDETLSFWQIYHTDGTEKVYIKHKITGTALTLTDATGFNVGDRVIGQTSLGVDTGATATIHSKTGNVVTMSVQEGTAPWAVTNLVKHSVTNITTPITTVVLGDCDNKSIPIDSTVYGVSRLFPFSLGQGQAGAASLFNLQYQLRLHELGNLANVSLAYYVQTMTNLQTLNSILNGAPLFRFNRFHDKLIIDAYWGSNLNVDNVVLIEGYKATDPVAYTRAFGDPWIVKHLTATIKGQWGINLKKFSGIQLVGGVSLDGQSMYDEAMSEKIKLEDDLVNNGAPLEFFTG